MGRRQRLAGATDYRQVLSRGARQRYEFLDFLWVVNDVGHPRLGLVVPKFQSSVVARNRLRRRLKEIARRVVFPRLKSVDLVIRARREAYGASFGQLALEVGQWLSSRAPRNS
ncbi:MAG: ribonuclease P protein component [Gemmatimonadales bacterium]